MEGVVGKSCGLWTDFSGIGERAKREETRAYA